jgi:hypothetical protein
VAKTIDDRIAELEALTLPDLRARWQHAFGKPAPKHASRDLLLRALAYRLQEQAEGGLRPATRRRLAKLAGLNGEEPKPLPPPAPRLKSGSRLVREWRGEVHQVTVLDDGFDYRGTCYGNLSRIARTITGTRWSGPVFFGLRKSAARSMKDDDGR